MERDPSAAGEEDGGLLYLYGVVREDGSGSPSSVVYHGLAALVETVASAVFAPAALEQRLASVEWVAELARRHEARLAAAMQSGPVIPARLCTLFSGDEAVRKLLADSEEEFLALLDRLTDAEEWGIKVYCDMAALRTATADEATTEALAAGGPPVSPGQAYVLARQRDADLTARVTRRLEEILDHILDEVEPLTLESSARALLPAAATMRPERMLLNLAVLVARDGLAALEAALDELGDELGREGVVLDRSGPWPPYSFTGPTDEVS